jgi:hypothetical protein
MTSCQRPKECEPSRYRHGSDPPKQVDTGSLTDRKCPSTTYSLFHTIAFIQHKVVLSRPERCPTPTKRRSFPCHRPRSLSLSHVPRKNRYSFCRRSEQQFMLTEAVALRVPRCLLTGSRLMKMERSPDSIVQVRPCLYTSRRMRTNGRRQHA